MRQLLEGCCDDVSTPSTTTAWPSQHVGSWRSWIPIIITSVPCFVLAAERQMFLATWKDIPNENEAQFQIKDCSLNAGESKPFTRALGQTCPLN